MMGCVRVEHDCDHRVMTQKELSDEDQEER